MHPPKKKTTYNWNELEEKTDSNLYQRKESRLEIIYVHVQPQQNCSHKTWHMHIEIVFNVNTEKEFCFSALEKENIWYSGIVIFWLGGKICIWRNEKRIVFPVSWYVNSNSECCFNNKRKQAVSGVEKIGCSGNLWKFLANHLWRSFIGL